MLRKLLQATTKSLVIKRKLPARYSHTPVYVTPDSALQYLKPNLGKTFHELFAIVDEFVEPGSVVWDIGANVGMLTFAAAFRAGSEGEVVALEADPLLAATIQRSARLTKNQGLNVHVLCAAVADQYGIARFSIANRGRSSNALESVGGRSQMGGSRYVQHVPTLSADDLLETFTAPSFVKIDVEGAEIVLLEHARRLLSEVRPVIYCEVGKEQRSRVYEIFTAQNYQLFNGDLPTDQRQQLETCTFNTLALPAERQT